MSVTPALKQFVQDVPAPVGRLLARIPPRVLPYLGRRYSRGKREIMAFEALGLEAKEEFVFARVRNVVAHAFKQVPFYERHYAEAGFQLEDLKSFKDISRIPIVTKEDLREADLEDRSAAERGRYVENTGGSSGSPLSFYVSPLQIPIEWAHMHSVWEMLGYRPSDSKLVFGGRNLGGSALLYDGLRNSYVLSVYTGIDSARDGLIRILRRRSIRYLHGYPSAMYQFTQYCEDSDPDLLRLLRESLVGALLGSEFPAPLYRERIERVFRIPSVSWYGHTERAILAREKTRPFLYEPFQTYGLCEVVDNPATGGGRLIGTSYLNKASPFIRYDTGDDVEKVESQGGLLKSFSIRDGRRGEFVEDRNHVRIPLTGLIFGRHHSGFAMANFVQVRQHHPGQMTLLITPRKRVAPGVNLSDWFDMTGIAMRVDYEILDSPVISPSGKVMLKVE